MKLRKLLPLSAVPVEPPSTDSPFMETGQRKYILKIIQVSSASQHLLTDAYMYTVHSGTWKCSVGLHEKMYKSIVRWQRDDRNGKKNLFDNLWLLTFF